MNKRFIKVKVADTTFEQALILGNKENNIFWDLLEYIKKNQPVRAKELEKFGESVIYNLLQKLVNSGLLDKTDKGYMISSKFSEYLRKFAQEWEEFVEE